MALRRPRIIEGNVRNGDHAFAFRISLSHATFLGSNRRCVRELEQQKTVFGSGQQSVLRSASGS